MTAARMHPDEIPTSVDLARRLVATQFPRWADLPIEYVESRGTDNAIYRLGTDMAVRLPTQAHITLQLEKEREWLPRLAPHLPLAIPAPGDPTDPGDPTEGAYPLTWSIYPWFEGAPAHPDRLTDLTEAARTLATFIRALHTTDPTGGPEPGRHNFGRGVPLADRDAITRHAIAASEDLVDTEAVAAAWTTDSAAPTWNAPPVWIHGDLQPGNLLAADGHLTAVIDWGGLGIGDPAVDLLPAWNLFSGVSREAFRDSLEVDEATWARGRGWALSTAIVALPYYIDTNPSMVRMSRRVIDEVLADDGR